jgi:hypothetical protein
MAAAIHRRALVYMLAEPYVGRTLAAIKRHAGVAYAAHATAREVVRDHCAHWEDLLAPERRRTLDVEVERLRRMCAEAEPALLAYARACVEGVAPEAPLERVDVAALVVCVWHHVWAAAARGASLDAAACAAAVNDALKSVRDVARALAVAASEHDPYGIARYAR